MDTIKPFDFAGLEKPSKAKDFDNYDRGVQVLDHDVKTYKRVLCEPTVRLTSLSLAKCVATLINPKGATIVVPDYTNKLIKSNGAFVDSIQCADALRFGKCYALNSNYSDYEDEYIIGSHVSSNLDAVCYPQDHGIYSYRAKLDAQRWYFFKKNK
jgi:hypothetical protein